MENSNKDDLGTFNFNPTIGYLATPRTEKANSSYHKKSDSVSVQKLATSDASKNMNISMLSDTKEKTPLNWKAYLKDENVLIDSLNFQKWDKGPCKDENLIERDLKRTRCELPLLQKEAVLKCLREIAAFYCYATNSSYQQGLLEMIIPFMLLKNKDFKLHDCYAYFASFMRKYFPNILTPKYLGSTKELPHVHTVINYCDLLLSYHCYEIWDLFKEKNIDFRLFATPWVMTLFTKGTPLELVYEIFDKYMRENDKLFLFYLVIALLLMCKEKILQLGSNSDEGKLIIYMNKYAKDETLTSSSQISQLFEIARNLKKKTPQSFEISLKILGFTEVSILSIQEVKELMGDHGETIFQIYPYEIINYILQYTLNTTDKKATLYDRDLMLKFLDCRKKKAKYLPFSINVPYRLSEKNQELEEYLSLIIKSEKNAHLCLVYSSENDDEEKNFAHMILNILKSDKVNYLSVLFGGFEGVLKELSKRKVNIPFYEKPSTTFEDKKGFFEKIFDSMFG